MSFFRSQGKEKREESGTQTVYIPVFLCDLPAALKKDLKLPVDLKQLGPIDDGATHDIDVRRFIDGPTDYKKIAEILTNNLREKDYAVQNDYDLGAGQKAARAFQGSWYKYVLGIVFIETRIKWGNVARKKQEYQKYDGDFINKGTVINPEDIVGFHKGPCAYNGMDISQIFPQFPDHGKQDIEFMPIILAVSAALAKEARSDKGTAFLSFVQTIGKLNAGQAFTKEDAAIVETIKKLTQGQIASGFSAQLETVVHEMNSKLTATPVSSPEKKEAKQSDEVTIFIPVFLRNLPDRNPTRPTELKALGPEQNGNHCIDVRRFIENDFQKIAEVLNEEFKRTDIPYKVQKDYDPLYEGDHEQPGARAFQGSFYKYVMGIVFVEARVKAADLIPGKIYEQYDGYTVKPTTVISKENIVGFHKGPCMYGKDIKEFFPDFPDHAQNQVGMAMRSP